jgi:hypothetical protein
MSAVPVNTVVADAAIQRHLREVLGVDIELRPWDGASTLPYFLLERFDLRASTLLGHPLLFATQRPVPKTGLSDLRRALETLRSLSNLPVLYVTDRLASYERRRLVTQHVPFLVPGNQLYLPDLGIDLREYFRQSLRAEPDALSPATQALLIAHWLRTPWRAEWQPAVDCSALGYTPMTLTRCVRELTAAGVATSSSRARQRFLTMSGDPQEWWVKAAPLLRSPVKRTVWVDHAEATRHAPALRLAGQSALARLTSLTVPPRPVHALSPAQWRSVTAEGLRPLPAPVEGCGEWQLWRYSPALWPDVPTVDPLSLTLSLQHDADARVQLALEELRAHFPW